MVKGKIDLKALARVGAAIALAEHRRMVKDLETFLRKKRVTRQAPAPEKKHLSAAERKAISKRMKQYWASKRAER